MTTLKITSISENNTNNTILVSQDNIKDIQVYNIGTFIEITISRIVQFKPMTLKFTIEKQTTEEFVSLQRLIFSAMSITSALKQEIHIILNHQEGVVSVVKHIPNIKAITKTYNLYE